MATEREPVLRLVSLSVTYSLIVPISFSPLSHGLICGLEAENGTTLGLLQYTTLC